MTKIYLDPEKLKGSGMSDLNNAIRHLNNAINAVGTLYIPRNFYYATSTSNIMYNNNTCLNALKKKRKFIENSINEYAKVTSDNVEGMNSLKTIEVPLNKNLIK